MVEYIDQQEGWTGLIHVTTIVLDEVRDSHKVSDGGITYATKVIHLCLFKRFLLYYKQQCCELYMTLSEDDIMYGFNRHRFEEYCSSDDYNDD
jgi:hypothetical protein